MTKIKGIKVLYMKLDYYSKELIKIIKDSEEELATAKRYDNIEAMHQEILEEV